MNGSIIYNIGSDYTFDPVTKKITILTGGNITPGSQVKVSFDLQRNGATKDGPTTYSTFFEMDFKKAPTLAPLTFASDFESAYIVFNGKQYSFTDSVSLFQDISKHPKDKWIQVVVLSRPILAEDDTIDTIAAIYKVINATDQATGLLIFKKGVFFKRQRAFINPMMEIPYFKLKYDTYPTNRSVFSVDDDDVIINWDPVTQPELLYLTAGGSIQKREDFELQYSYTIDSDKVVTGIKLKAEFSRDPSEPVYRTPVLEEYSLRLSY
jgi:hypothetical protein